MHFSISWVEFQKQLLSSLKSARSNSLKCQVLCMIGDASFCVFWTEFEKQIVLFEISFLKIFNMQNYIKKHKKFQHWGQNYLVQVVFGSKLKNRFVS